MTEPSEKARLRAALLERRAAADPELRAQWSADVAERAMALLRAEPAGVLAGYHPIRAEVDPLPILQRAEGAGFRLAMPAVEGDRIAFRAWRFGEELHPSGFGTMAPSGHAQPASPDIMLVPLAGFDKRGFRIGYGRGHYDRAIAGLLLAGRRPLLIGLAFALQEVATVPAEPHDIALDSIITETDTFTFAPRTFATGPAR